MQVFTCEMNKMIRIVFEFQRSEIGSENHKRSTQVKVYFPVAVFLNVNSQQEINLDEKLFPGGTNTF